MIYYRIENNNKKRYEMEGGKWDAAKKVFYYILKEVGNKTHHKEVCIKDEKFLREFILDDKQ